MVSYILQWIKKIFQISDEQCMLLDLFTFCVDRFLSSYMYKTVTEVILVSKKLFKLEILSDILQQIKKYLKYLINNAFCYICLNFCVDRCTSSYIYKTVTEVILVSRNCQTMLSDILQQIKKYSRYLINNAFYQIYCRTVTELILVSRNCLLHNAFRHPSVDQEILQSM